jgi:hypothetical protein
MRIILYLLLSFLLLSQVAIASNETESEAERILKTTDTFEKTISPKAKYILRNTSGITKMLVIGK